MSQSDGQLALDEFLGEAHVGRLASVLGLTHSGAVRLVSQLEAEGLALRRTGADRRRVEVRLTARGRQRATAPRRPPPSGSRTSSTGRRRFVTGDAEFGERPERDHPMGHELEPVRTSLLSQRSVE